MIRIKNYVLINLIAFLTIRKLRMFNINNNSQSQDYYLLKKSEKN